MFRNQLKTVLFVFVLSSFIAWIGCRSEKTEQSPGSSSSTSSSAGSDAIATEKPENPDFPPFHSHTVGRKGGPIAVLGRHQFHAEFLPDEETGDISVLAYDSDFMPITMEAKELTLDIMVGGEPKKYTFLVNNPGSDSTVAVYKLSDADLAKLLKEGWEGNTQVSITEKGNPTSGKLYNPKK